MEINRMWLNSRDVVTSIAIKQILDMYLTIHMFRLIIAATLIFDIVGLRM